MNSAFAKFRSRIVPSIDALLMRTRKLGIRMKGADFDSQTLLMTRRAPGSVTPVMQGIPFFTMPAFSAAIFSRVFPRISVCSRPTFVMTEIKGRRTFVASSRPPRPASMIATSTFFRAKWTNAIAVVASKNVACCFSICLRSSDVSWTTSFFEIGRPLMRMRSVKSIRCGEVYSPVL